MLILIKQNKELLTNDLKKIDIFTIIDNRRKENFIRINENRIFCIQYIGLENIKLCNNKFRFFLCEYNINITV